MVKVVQLRNPWGTFEWKGEWNDEDERWTPELHALTAQAAGADHRPEDDGSFFMSHADFVKYYGKVNRALLYPWIGRRPFLVQPPISALMRD